KSQARSAALCRVGRRRSDLRRSQDAGGNLSCCDGSRSRISGSQLCPFRRASFRFEFMPTTGERFERAVSIMTRLRAPGGCPWDREQTFDTIKPYTLEEAYEVVEAIDARDWDE